MQKIVFSADDFGLTQSVNQAVERAHRHGTLSQASLMVAAPAAADAILRAKANPNLKVGLHLVLVDGDSLLGHKNLPLITTPDGRFHNNQVFLGFLYFFSHMARRELAAEILAQYAAYAGTGLPLHHADAHKHMHLHPTIAALMIQIGATFGLRRLRIPAEPPAVLKACGETTGVGDHALYLLARLLRARARRAGLQTPDHVFGIKWSGHMTIARIETLMQHLPPGSSEIYFHPATRRDDMLKTLMPAYEHEAELQTLLDLRAIQAARL